MPMNRVQFQPGLSMPDFIRQYGAEAQCEAALMQAHWPEGFRCPGCGHGGHCVLHAKAAKRSTAMPATGRVPDCRDIVPGDESALVHLVSGDLFGQPSQDWFIGLGIEAVFGRELPQRLAHSP